MLTLEEIQKNYAAHGGYAAHARNILVEYIQYELLDSLFKQPASAPLSFMGGTSIRIVYGSGRFSEDLDFDNFGLSFEAFQTLLDAAMDDMRVKGFKTEYRFVEKGAYHCYVRFPHVLQDNRLSPLHNEKILVRIDTMQKQKLHEPLIHTLNAFDVYRPIAVNPPDVILVQKLIAIKDRVREKGRDFYDVSYLYGLATPNIPFLERTTGMSYAQFSGAILARCEELDFDSLARDVEPFLLNPDHTNRVRTFLQFLKTKMT